MPVSTLMKTMSSKQGPMVSSAVSLLLFLYLMTSSVLAMLFITIALYWL